MGNFRALKVWQKSVDLVTEIYRITESFPKNEIFGLTQQLRRASVSIPSNIAEGHSRRSTLDYIQFLKIARGSLAELETQILISYNLNFFNQEQYDILNQKIIEIAKMLNALIRKIEDSLSPNTQSLNPKN